MDDDLYQEGSNEQYSRRKSIAAERYDPEADKEPFPKHPKSDEQRRRLKEAIKNNFLFSSLEIEELQIVIDAMFEKQVKEGDIIIKEGDDGDNFYVIDHGKYNILKKVDGKDKKVGTYENKGAFGELALMYNQPRAATIISASAGVIWALDRVSFRRIMLKSAFEKRKLYERFLEEVPLLKELDHYERLNLCDALQTRRFKAKDVIIKQGDKADGMYFMESGAVSVKRKEGSKEEEVAKIKVGGYFGELALLTKQPRAATVAATDDCRCAFLEVDSFERLLGSCKDIMQRNRSAYKDQLKTIFGSSASLEGLR